MQPEKQFRAPRIHPDRELIERMIAWRRLNRPADDAPIRTALSPEALHKALGLNRPQQGDYPRVVLYQNYEIEAHA